MYVGGLASTGIGSIAAPALIDLIGIRGALALGGALLPAVALVIYPRLSRIDDYASVPEAALSAVAAVPLFEPMPPTSLEKLARAAVRDRACGHGGRHRGRAGRHLLRGRGRPFEVSSEGRALRTLGPGGFSARSHSCARCRERRPYRRRRTPPCSRFAGWTSSRPSSATATARRRSRRSSPPGSGADRGGCGRQP